MLIPWWLKVLALGALAAGAWVAFDHWRDGIWQEGYDDRTVEYEAATAQAAIARAAEVRAIEIAQAAAFNRVAETYEQERKDAQAQADRIAAELRAGSLRLRRQWQGCQASTGLSADAPSTAEPNARADDRAGSAGRIVRAADACDAQVRGLQAAIRVMQGQQ